LKASWREKEGLTYLSASVVVEESDKDVDKQPRKLWSGCRMARRKERVG
jgi:hypothetical protein